MTIYILDNDPAKCAQMLDDKSLDRMIKDIAQVLCNVHWEVYYHEGIDRYKNKTLPPAKYLQASRNKSINTWAQWAKECAANYHCLVELGLSCIAESHAREIAASIGRKHRDTLKWARDNVPDLPNRDKEIGCGCPECEENFKNCARPLPLVIPKKYVYDNSYAEHISNTKDAREYTLDSTITSYRNYYKAKIKLKHFGEVCTCICFKKDMQWTRRALPDFIKEIL